MDQTGDLDSSVFVSFRKYCRLVIQSESTLYIKYRCFNPKKVTGRWEIHDFCVGLTDLSANCKNLMFPWHNSLRDFYQKSGMYKIHNTTKG